MCLAVDILCVDDGVESVLRERGQFFSCVTANTHTHING